MSAKVWKLGIIGWPLGYSLSPLMHTAALEAAGLQGEYREYPVAPESLWEWLSRVNDLGLDGFNVTMPYKKSVFSWVVGEGRGKLGRLEEMSGVVGAINTVVVREQHPVGYNTDGESFLQVLTEPTRSMDLSGWHVVLLGAGGAARTIAVALALKTHVEQLTIWNRHAEAATLLSVLLKALKQKSRTRIEVRAEQNLEALPLKECQMLINATPAGMKGHEELPLDYGQLHAGQIVYDIVYEPRETRLIQEARKRGCMVITGEEMLAAQGAEAFEIWTGVPAEKVLPAMKKALDGHFAAGR